MPEFSRSGFSRRYGASPAHLLTLLGCLAVAGYAAVRLPPHHVLGIGIWWAGAVIGHDLILFPLYSLADRSARAVLRRWVPGPRGQSGLAWINYLRVPAALSGLLLGIWFPLIFRQPGGFPATTTLPLTPYLGHWLTITGVLFAASAAAVVVRLARRH